MFTYNALEGRFGKFGAERLRKIQFISAESVPGIDITHSAQCRIPLMRAVPVEGARKEQIDWYADFLAEVINIVDVQAVELFSNIQIAPDMSDSVLYNCRHLMDKVLAGHELYVPHLDSPYKPPQMVGLGDKFVGLDLVFFIRDPSRLQRLGAPRLYWFIITRPVTLDRDNRTKYTDGAFIERISDTQPN